MNEKQPGVSVNRSLWIAATFCVGVMLAVGVPGAIAFGDVLEGSITGAWLMVAD